MKNLENPLDALFNTPPLHEDEKEYAEITEAELALLAVPPEDTEKDLEDTEIDGKIDKVYDLALDAFNTQTQYQEIIEPRYAARNAEVAANYLSIALNAATSRAKVKGERKKQMAFIPYGDKSGSGTVIASREEIMRMISVDAETKNV